VLLARLPGAQRLASWILHDPVAAEDAVQEAALLAWDRRRSLRDPGAGEAWFNRILVNVCPRRVAATRPQARGQGSRTGRRQRAELPGRPR